MIENPEAFTAASFTLEQMEQLKTLFFDDSISKIYYILVPLISALIGGLLAIAGSFSLERYKYKLLLNEKTMFEARDICFEHITICQEAYKNIILLYNPSELHSKEENEFLFSDIGEKIIDILLLQAKLNILCDESLTTPMEKLIIHLQEFLRVNTSYDEEAFGKVEKKYNKQYREVSETITKYFKNYLPSPPTKI